MGGYHTYDEVVADLQKMEEDYPDIVSLSEIGRSLESRPVYALKISDQVDQNESESEGVVYFDALTHAREPMSMETLLYYMWWLLENYQQEEESSYLINNRQIYFAPVVNPDGYVFNQANSPDGGGLWRKNRRIVNGACQGVDLNRNFGYQWGIDNGSSIDPCNNNYRGSGAFSEIETRNIRNFTQSIRPTLAFSCHAFDDALLIPNGYDDRFSNFAQYAELTSEMIPPRYEGYGNWNDQLEYFGSGTTQDFLDSEGTLAWTPEIGHSFWEPSSNICDRVQEIFPALKYITRASGAYVGFNGFYLPSNPSIWPGDTIDLALRIKNRGYRLSAPNVRLEASSIDNNIVFVEDEVDLGNIPARKLIETANLPIRFYLENAPNPGQLIPIKVKLYQDNVLTFEKTINIYAGQGNTLLTENAEDRLNTKWDSPLGVWDSTQVDAHTGRTCISDSRRTTYAPNANTAITTKSTLDFTTTTNPYLEFSAKWSLEGNSESDGFYFDDFRIVDYVEPLNVQTTELASPLQQAYISPNPSTGNSFLEWYNDGESNSQISISDVAGKIIYQQKNEQVRGWQRQKLNFPQGGLYLVSITQGKSSRVIKVVHH